MSDAPRRSSRKKRSNERIIPVTVENNPENESIVVSSSSDKTIDDVPPTATTDDEAICDSVQAISLQSNEDVFVKEDPENTLPAINVTEKIILVYDCVREAEATGFQINGDSVSVADVVKRCMRMYVTNKNLIDRRHEFALVALRKDRVDWVKGFTTNAAVIKSELENLPAQQADDMSDAYLDLDELFYLIKAKARIPSATEDLRTIPPAFTVRVVFVYTRSNCTPVFQSKESLGDIVECPYFNFDVLLVHENPDEGNNVRAVFEKLSEIDPKGTSYCSSIGKSYKDLHFGMAKLLAHPLQRPRQQVGSYCINC